MNQIGMFRLVSPCLIILYW